MKTVTLLRDVQAGGSQKQVIPAGSRVRYAYDQKQALPIIIGTARETGIEHSVEVGWEDVLNVGSRVEGGEGEDYDTGTIEYIYRFPMPHSEKISNAWRLVAAVLWDRGVTTNSPINTLAPI